MQNLTVSLLLAGVAVCGLAQAENPQYEESIKAMKNEMAAGITAAGVVAMDSLMPKNNSTHRGLHSGQANFVVLPRLLPARNSSKTL